MSRNFHRVLLVYRSISGSKIVLPVHYNTILQGFIYHTLSSFTATHFHDQGFQTNGRSFKMFSFSEILDEAKLVQKNNAKMLSFDQTISFILSSPFPDFIMEFTQQNVFYPQATLGTNQLSLVSYQFISDPEYTAPMKIQMISKMTQYSTYQLIDQKRLTVYYHPYQKQFEQLMCKNLLKKQIVLSKANSLGDTTNFYLRKISNKRSDFGVIIFKNTPIECWGGSYEIDGDPELIRISYECGLGSKNSAGFGLWVPDNS
jgi:CRISPR-associated endoribonuclease Cas6